MGTNNTNAGPKTVKAFLAALKAALKGAPRGLIQDALADAEDHLRAACRQHADQKEEQVMAAMIESYGSPAEVAEAYRDADGPSGPYGSAAASNGSGYSFFGAIADPHAYGALLYMLLSLATGIFYFTWVVTGAALSAGFMILIIGIPFALLFLASIRVIAHLEGRIIEALLGVRMPRRPPQTAPVEGGMLGRIKAMLTDTRTWTAMLYMVVQLGLGIIYFTIAVTGLAVAIAFIAAPFAKLISAEEDFVIMTDWPQLDTFLNSPEGAFVLLPLGILLIFLVLNIARVIGYLHGRIAEHVLVRL